MRKDFFPLKSITFKGAYFGDNKNEWCKCSTITKNKLNEMHRKRMKMKKNRKDSLHFYRFRLFLWYNQITVIASHFRLTMYFVFFFQLFNTFANTINEERKKTFKMVTIFECIDKSHHIQNAEWIIQLCVPLNCVG